MVYEIGLGLHYVAILLFGGYILLDRLLFRPFFALHRDAVSRFYRSSRNILLPTVVVIILSGLIMAGMETARLNNPLFILKIILAGVLIGMFFYCPVFSRGHGEKARRLYRTVVVILLLAVVAISKFLI